MCYDILTLQEVSTKLLNLLKFVFKRENLRKTTLKNIKFIYSKDHKKNTEMIIYNSDKIIVSNCETFEYDKEKPSYNNLQVLMFTVKNFKHIEFILINTHGIGLPEDEEMVLDRFINTQHKLNLDKKKNDCLW